MTTESTPGDRIAQPWMAVMRAWARSSRPAYVVVKRERGESSNTPCGHSGGVYIIHAAVASVREAKTAELDK